MPVLPGDVMNASVSPVPPLIATPGVPFPWLITLTDTTAGWTFSITMSYVGSQNSAEWVVEAPTACNLFSCWIETLPAFSTVTFDMGDTVTPSKDGNGNPVFLDTDAMAIEDLTETIVAAPSGPDCDSDGFAVAAGAISPPVPGPGWPAQSLPKGWTGQPYSGTLSVFGLSSPSAHSFQAVQNTMPPGLTVNASSGTISGVPTRAGNYQMQITVTDTATGAQCMDTQIPLTIGLGRTIIRPKCLYDPITKKLYCW
jgi:hypothetical protein